MRIVKLGRHARRSNVDETVRPLLVETDYPIPNNPADLAPSSTAAIVNSLALARHPSSASQTGEPRQLYSLSAPELPGRWQTTYVCHVELCRSRFGNPQWVNRSAGWYYSFALRELVFCGGGKTEVAGRKSGREFPSATATTRTTYEVFQSTWIGKALSFNPRRYLQCVLFNAI